jgi:hypothetical protein
MSRVDPAPLRRVRKAVAVMVQEWRAACRDAARLP